VDIADVHSGGGRLEVQPGVQSACIHHRDVADHILVRGIKESANANSIMVILKLAAIFAFVIAGASLSIRKTTPVHAERLAGRAHRRLHHLLHYIGFDSYRPRLRSRRTAARCAHGIIATLVICTILYISVVVVLTGMEKWNLLDPAAPVVEVLKKYNLGWVRAGVLFGPSWG